MEKTKKIYVYAVVPYEQWMFIKNKGSEEEKNQMNDFDYWQEYDYAVTAIMVEESLVFLDDNIHNRPSDVLNGIVLGLEKFFPVDTFEDVLLLSQDIYEYNETKVQNAIYEKWKSEN